MTGRFRRSRALGAAVALLTVTSVLAAFASPSVADARRRASVVILLTQPMITLSDTTIRICADEKYTVEATVEEEVYYRWSNEAAPTQHRSHRPLSRAATITTSGSNGNATYTPSSAVVRPPRQSVTFEITGKTPGHDLILFQVGPTTTQPLQITVVECSYKLTTTSNWLVPVGFKPDITAGIHDLQLRRVRENFYQGTGPLLSFAVGEHIGGCTPVFNIADSPVVVTAEIVPGQYRPEVKLTITFSALPASTTVTCPRVPGQGQSTDTATIQPINTNMKAWETIDAKSIPGHMAQSHLGSYSSTTLLALELVRP